MGVLDTVESKAGFRFVPPLLIVVAVVVGSAVGRWDVGLGVPKAGVQPRGRGDRKTHV